MKLLLVEDDITLVQQLKPRLNRAGYTVEVANNGVDGEFLGTEEAFDIVILDLGLPQKNGLEVLRHWRRLNLNMPVIILTARDAWHERVDGLKAGADDYLGKPFHGEELLARLEVLIRRRFGSSGSQLCCSGITLNTDRQQVTNGDGETFELTGIEYRLLHYLMSNPGKVISKTELSERMYEEDQLKDSNVIEVYINRLRKMLGKSTIETRRGQGYCFKFQ
ncbi:response regulator transcription factor [Gynuella sp.]|uniref:response regulator transcription factor n=1 Tax=Gynuella sp. TaxID=2969146 RepID=UPI003D1068FC